MDASKHQAEALKTWREDKPSLSGQRLEIANAAMGVANEAGELAGLVKKILFYGKSLDRDALIDELGDVYYYAAMLAHHLDVSPETVMERNITKLRARHGERFYADHYADNGAGGDGAGGALADSPKRAHVYRDFG